MSVNNVASLHIVSRFQDQNVVQTLHYEVMEQGSDEEDILQNLCEQWQLTYEAGLQAIVNDDLTIIGYKAFNKVGDATVPGFKDSGNAGSVVATAMPAFINKTLTLYTESTKYRRRGRFSVCGVSETEIGDADGSVTSVARAALLAFGATLITSLTGGGDSWRLVIPATVADPSEPIVGCLARLKPTILKSRRIREYLIG